MNLKYKYKKKYLDIIFSDNKKYLVIWALLKILAFLYGVVITLVRFKRSRLCYKSRKIVISVGNITWGGTGKTPLVIELGRYIQNRGLKIGVIHHGDWAGDEVTLLKESLPGARVLDSFSKRSALIELEKDENIDLIIIDDGYQNWDISRDLDILCLNFKAPFGNGSLIPRGSLRERCSAVGRADIIMVNKTVDKDNFPYRTKIKRYNPKAFLIFTEYKIKELYDVLGQREVSGRDISGIKAAFITAVADPYYVRRVLIDAGIDLQDGYIYPDHYIFKDKDLALIAKDTPDVKAIFITEKDYVKIKDNLEFAKDVFNDKLLILFKVNLEYLDNEKTLFRRLDILLGSLSG
jgi:tetraacyldisaccharide 4'-kinase